MSSRKHRGTERLLQKPILFLLLWLIVPILLILALAYQSPKFNPRYTLLAWPALTLLTSHLITTLLTLPTSHVPRPTLFLSRTLGLLFLTFIISLSAFSLTNWFTDPRFSKADFRALAQFIKERKTPHETVLLSSGHLYPVFIYYYGFEGWTGLPQMQRLDVNKVTTLRIADELAPALKNYDGVWLVTWQDEVIDPNGIVPFWLDVIGDRPNDAGDFWGVGLEHWAIDSDRIEKLTTSPINQPAIFDPETDKLGKPLTTDNSYNFANQVELLGFTQLSDTDLALFWRPQQPLPDELIMNLILADDNGFGWGEEPLIEQLGSPYYSPSRWPVGEIMMTRHQLSWQIGTPPGLYALKIGLGVNTTTENGSTTYEGWDILDSQHRPQQRIAFIDFVNLRQLVQPVTGPLPVDDDPVVDFMPIVGMRRSILRDKTAQPGDRILLAALWQAGEFNLDNISLVFDLVDAQGQTHQRVGASYTPSREFILPRWNIGDTVLGQYWLDIPPEVAPGPAKLHVHLINVSGFAYDQVFSFDTLEILPTERNFTPPSSMDIPVEVNFSGQARLLGVDCPHNCTASAGDTLTLTLYWQALASMDTSYTVFTHLLTPAETVLINADHTPPKPSQAWVPDEIITDQVNLTIPADLTPGSYTVEVGLYNANDPDFTRLVLDNGDTRVLLPQKVNIK